MKCYFTRVKALSLSEFKGATVIIFTQPETVEDPEFPFKGSSLKMEDVSAINYTVQILLRN